MEELHPKNGNHYISYWQHARQVQGRYPGIPDLVGCPRLVNDSHPLTMTSLEFPFTVEGKVGTKMYILQSVLDPSSNGFLNDLETMHLVPKWDLDVNSFKLRTV